LTDIKPAAISAGEIFGASAAIAAAPVQSNDRKASRLRQFMVSVVRG
jgi:hypothetical protein